MTDADSDLILFSIIVPTYNRASFVKAAVESILHQTYNHFEVIIIDDGSTDNTEETILRLFSHLPKVAYFKQNNSERGAARNRGSELAKGKYIMFFDSDDLMMPNHLEEARRFIKHQNFPEIFHLNYEVKTPEGRLIRVGPSSMETANAKLIHGNFLSCNGVILRRDVALSNPFNEDRTLAAMEDWELWLRLAVQYQIYMVSKITTTIVDHDSRSVSQADKGKLKARVNMLMQCVLQNEDVAKYYSASLASFKSSCFTYVSLHLAIIGGDRSEAISYLINGIREDYSAIFTRRFVAILKHLL
ncbi:MAG: glycosyltransferase family 2 protein [Cyclobacteriaceae bacterium]|nr:glycosyltransferase family 2 protein [Cyclobacteriaceae bacterium]